MNTKQARPYEVYWNGRRHFTGSHSDAVSAAREGMAKGFSVWLAQRGTVIN